MYGEDNDFEITKVIRDERTGQVLGYRRSTETSPVGRADWHVKPTASGDPFDYAEGVLHHLRRLRQHPDPATAFWAAAWYLRLCRSLARLVARTPNMTTCLRCSRTIEAPGTDYCRTCTRMIRLGHEHKKVLARDVGWRAKDHVYHPAYIECSLCESLRSRVNGNEERAEALLAERHAKANKGRRKIPRGSDRSEWYSDGDRLLWARLRNIAKAVMRDEAWDADTRAAEAAKHAAREDDKAKIRRLHAEYPEWSQRRIAKAVGCTQAMVSKALAG